MLRTAISLKDPTHYIFNNDRNSNAYAAIIKKMHAKQEVIERSKSNRLRAHQEREDSMQVQYGSNEDHSVPVTAEAIGNLQQPSAGHLSK